MVIWLQLECKWNSTTSLSSVFSKCSASKSGIYLLIRSFLGHRHWCTSRNFLNGVIGLDGSHRCPAPWVMSTQLFVEQPCEQHWGTHLSLKQPLYFLAWRKAVWVEKTLYWRNTSSETCVVQQSALPCLPMDGETVSSVTLPGLKCGVGLTLLFIHLFKPTCLNHPVPKILCKSEVQFQRDISSVEYRRTTKFLEMPVLQWF